MRPVLLGIAAAIGTIMLLAVAHTGASAYWQARATSSIAVQPAAIALTAVPNSTYLQLWGDSGTAHAWIDFANTGEVDLTSVSVSGRTLVTAVPDSTVTYQQVAADANCATATGAWLASPAVAGPLAAGASFRLCSKFQWSGATTAHNGLSLTQSVDAIGTLPGGSTIMSEATMVHGVHAGAAPPAMSCAPADPFTVLISYATANSSYAYDLRAPGGTIAYSLSAFELEYGLLISYDEPGLTVGVVNQLALVRNGDPSAAPVATAHVMPLGGSIDCV